jgi:DNA primase
MDLDKLANAAAQRNRTIQVREEPEEESRATAQTQTSQQEEPIRAEPVLELLAMTLLHSTEARLWLLEEDWRAQLRSEPQGEIIEQILERSEYLETSETLHRFLSSLSPAMEAFATALLDKSPPQHPLAVAQDCWSELERRQIRRLMEIVKAKQRNNSLSLEEAAGLHQQILDLQKRLMDIARPFSPLR